MMEGVVPTLANSLDVAGSFARMGHPGPHLGTVLLALVHTSMIANKWRKYKGFWGAPLCCTPACGSKVLRSGRAAGPKKRKKEGDNCIPFFSASHPPYRCRVLQQYGSEADA